MALASLQGLTYRYPGAETDALANAWLEVCPGLTVVTGPSGGGKSTLLRVLNGLVPHFHGGRISGCARVGGLDAIRTPTRELARQVGFVFQDPEMQMVYGTVEREVAFGLENLAFPAAAMAARVTEALDRVGIGHLARRRVATISGGERQRVALAAALALRPPLVVLDEPTSQLDPEGASLLLEACLALAREGRGVVISEHRLERLLPVADHVVAVAEGRVGPGGRLLPPWPAARPPRRPAGAIAWSLEAVTLAPSRGEPLLRDVDLAGGLGEVTVLSGPNGGGKTTLLRAIAGLLRPVAGTLERRPGRVAYLPQNPTLLLHLPTVRAEVELTLRRAGDPERPEEVLRLLGLGHVADRYPRDLSTGERQRAALAAILAGRPALVLLDEPTRGMDLDAREALVRLLRRLAGQGSSVVVATHDANLAGAIGDQEARVGDGRVRLL